MDFPIGYIKGYRHASKIPVRTLFSGVRALKFTARPHHPQRRIGKSQLSAVQLIGLNPGPNLTKLQQKLTAGIPFLCALEMCGGVPPPAPRCRGRAGRYAPARGYVAPSDRGGALGRGPARGTARAGPG